MNVQITLSAKIFNELHTDIIDKYIQRTKEQNQPEYQRYGFGKYSEDKPSLFSEFIKRFEAFTQEDFPYHYYKNNKFNGGKYLRDLRKQNKEKELHVNSAYLDVYLAYLEYHSLEDYLIHLLKEKRVTITDIEEQERIGKKNFRKLKANIPNLQTIIEFTAYYLDDHQELQDFIIKFNLSQNTTTILNSPEGFDYKGIIEEEGVNASLFYKTADTYGNSRRLSIILTKGYGSVKDREILMGVYSTVNQKAVPTCDLIFLRRKEADKDKIYRSREIEERLIIKYLEQEGNTIDEANIISSFFDLENNLEIKYPSWQEAIDISNKLVGEYECIVFDTREEALEVLYFQIQQGGNVLCRTLPLPSTYRGKLEVKGSVAEINTRKNNQISSYRILLKLPHNINQYELLYGVFSGITTNAFIRAGRCILRKIDARIYLNETPKYIKLEELAQHFKDIEFIKNVKAVFSGQENHDVAHFIENPNAFGSKIPRRFKSELAGHYWLYRQSSYEEKGIRAYPVEIKKDGSVLFKRRNSVKQSALSISHDSVYFKSFIENEKDEIIHSIAVFNKNDFFDIGSRVARGVFTKLNIDKNPMAIKCFIQASNFKFDDMDYHRPKSYEEAIASNAEFTEELWEFLKDEVSDKELKKNASLIVLNNQNLANKLRNEAR